MADPPGGIQRNPTGPATVGAMNWLLWIHLAVSTAFAEVPEETWPELLGQEVILTNPDGRTITGTVVRLTDDTVRLRRSSDDRLLEIHKAQVDTAALLNPPAPVEPPPVVPEPDPVAPDVDESADALLERALGPSDDAPADPPPADDPADPPAPDDPPAQDDGGTDAVLLESPQDAVDAAAEGFDDALATVDDAPRPTTSAETQPDAKPDAAPAPPKTYGPSQYQQGFTAGQLDAGNESVLGAFALGACTAATCTAGGCILNPFFGCLGGVALGVPIAPAWYGVVDPLLDEPELLAQMSDEDPEYAVGYVRGYTDELRRRRALMAAAGAGTGVLVGGVTGAVVIGARGGGLIE